MKFIKNILSGIAIGVANAIPGVSGGTIALILGIYSKLIESLGEFATNKDKRKEYLLFLGQIFIGGFIGLIIGAKVLKFAFETYPKQVNFLFIGLVLGSLPIVIKEAKLKKIEIKDFIAFIFGVFLVVLMGYLGKGEIGTEVKGDVITIMYGLKLMFVGALASGAMVIPGVSGSFLLLLLGEYENVLSFVNERELLPLGIMAFGAVIGLLLFTKIIDFLLKKYNKITMLFIIGLIIGSIIEIYPGIGKGKFENVVLFLFFIVGIAVPLLLLKVDKSRRSR